MNSEHAPSPRAQQGRPTAWSPSSVHEVLHRRLYRGEAVWNQSQKRNRWGQVRPQARPETDWIRQVMPSLRVVSDDLWASVHTALEVAREKYLRSGNGRIYGRPRDVESPYLLSGFCRCLACGGGFSILTRSHGRQRGFFYGCTSYHKRGRSVCENGRVAPMAAVDSAVLESLQDFVLRPDIVAAVVERTLAALAPEAAAAQAADLTRELTDCERQQVRIAEAIAQGGDVPMLVAALKARQARRMEIEGRLASLTAKTVRVDRAAVRRAVTQRLEDWRGLLGRHVPQGRQLLRKLLHGPIGFEPADEHVYRFSGQVHYGKLFAGVLNSDPTKLASPTGFDSLGTALEVERTLHVG